MTATPNSFVTPQTPVGTSVSVSTANTTRVNITANATQLSAGNVVALFGSNTNGILIDSIEVMPTGNTTTNVVRIWSWDTSVARLVDEFQISAATPANTTAIVPYIHYYSVAGRPWELTANQILYASTNNTEGYTVTAFGGAL
jgi:hypothetical protein